MPTESHFIGLDEEEGGPVQESTESTGDATLDAVDAGADDIDLEAALGGGIKKAAVAEDAPKPSTSRPRSTPSPNAPRHSA